MPGSAFGTNSIDIGLIASFIGAAGCADGQYATVRPARDSARQPMGELIGMLKHKGKPVPVDAMNGGEIAARLARKSRL